MLVTPKGLKVNGLRYPHARINVKLNQMIVALWSCYCSCEYSEIIYLK